MLRQQHGGSNHCLLRVCVLSLLAISFLQAVTGCGIDSPATPAQNNQATQTALTSATSTTQVVRSSVPSSSLHGPTNFLFTLPLKFSQVNGATTNNAGTAVPLDAQNIKTEITDELKRLLFVVDSHNSVAVYSPGVAPVKAQITPQTDGSTAIDYTQKVDSEAGTIAITFIGTLHKDQMTVTYQQQYTPSMLIQANASDVTVVFTAHVRWITTKQIPAAPNHGTYQIMSNSGIALKWAKASNAVAYNVYRLIADRNQQFQFLTTVRQPSYIDNSAEARHNLYATRGITYAIFSVGSTGVENPGGLAISITA